MKGINRVTLLGYVGADPIKKEKVVNFTLAVNDEYKTKDGNVQKTTTWIRCTAWNKLAEICANLITKGALVYAEGKLQISSYEVDGIKKYAAEVVLAEVRILKSRTTDNTADLTDAEIIDDLPF
jgi:single-strand DNA-binding protein